MIIGGSASGKNFIYEKHFSELPLLDIDKITSGLSGGDFTLARKFVSKGASEVKKRLLSHFSRGESVVNVGTGVLDSTLRKFRNAKEAGMKTAVVLVSVSGEVALRRNSERFKAGKQGLIPEWKVQKTNSRARENFREFEKETDFSMIINN